MNVLAKLRERKGLRDTLANISWLGGDRVLRMLGGVIVGTAVARYLGPGQFGLLNYALAIYGIFNLFSNLGLDFLVVRDVVLDEKSQQEILGTSFLLKGGASLLTTAAAVVVTHLMEPHDTTLLIIVALMSFASIAQAFDVIDYLFQAQTRSRYAVVPRNIVFLLVSVARLVAVFLHSGLLVFAWIAALEILLSELALAYVYLRRHESLLRWSWQTPRAKRLLKESWPLLLASLLVMIYMRTDQILLGLLASKEVVGQYTAAVKLSEIWYMLPAIICGSVMPRLLRIRENEPAVYYRRLQRLYEAMVLLSLLLAVATQFVSPLVVRLLYGIQFAPAAAVLSIHIWTGIFVFVGCVGGQQLVQEKLTIIELQRSAMGAVVNVALNLLWIPRYGAVGSAMATLVAQSIASYFADALDSRTRHIFRMKSRAYLHFWLLPRILFHGTEK